MKPKLWNKELFRHFSWKSDPLAALTVSIVIIPQGMAYALIAGLPPIYGLYAAFVPLIIYPLFGSSRQMSVGPVALVSILLFAGLSTIAIPGTDRYIELAMMTALLAGLIQVALSILRMGFLINFLSEPVIQGFTSGAATIIIFSQLGTIMGLELPGNSTIQKIILSLISHIEFANVFACVLGAITLAGIILLRRLNKRIPAGLIAIVITTALAGVFHWGAYGIDILGAIPKGLPRPSFTFFHWSDITLIFPLAFVISLISFVESLAIAKSISSRHNNYTVGANRELMALGLSKAIGSFFQAYPGSGSFARSAINDKSGAKSGISSIIAAVFVGIILLFLTPLFFFLPKPALGAIVISAVLGLVNYSYAIRLFAIDRKDFYVFMTTFCLTIAMGIQVGVTAGIILSIILILQKTSKPHYAVLGQLPGTRAFRNIKRYPQAFVRPDILILRYDQDLYFGNAEHFYEVIIEEIKGNPDTKILILNSGAIGHIDSTGIGKFKLLLQTLKHRKIKLILTHVRGPVRDSIVQNGLLDIIGQDNIYLNINDALSFETTSEGRMSINKEYAMQTSKKKEK